MPINLAVEDSVSEHVLKRLFALHGNSFEIGAVNGLRGDSHLRKTVRGWNDEARSIPLLLLADLDAEAYPLKLMMDWLPEELHPNLLIRVAMQEVAAWLLADTEGVFRFLSRPWQASFL